MPCFGLTSSHWPMRFWFGSCSPREGKKRQSSATPAILYPQPTGFKGISEISEAFTGSCCLFPRWCWSDLGAGTPREVNPIHPVLLYAVLPSKKKVGKVLIFRFSSLTQRWTVTVSQSLAGIPECRNVWQLNHLDRQCLLTRCMGTDYVCACVYIDPKKSNLTQ